MICVQMINILFILSVLCPLKKRSILTSGEFGVEFEVFEEIALGLVSTKLHDSLSWHPSMKFEGAKCSSTGMNTGNSYSCLENGVSKSSDSRGTNRNLVKSSLITQRMSRKGNCWSRAVAKNFFKTLMSSCMRGISVSK